MIPSKWFSRSSYKFSNSYLNIVIRLLCLLLFVFGGAQVNAATITVPAGGDFQAALDVAQPGDTIILEASAAFIGNFHLRNKPGSTDYITIRTSNMAGIPADGVRVDLTHDSAMPRVLAPGNGAPAIEADSGAGFYRFVGIYISVNYAGGGHGSSFLISLSNGNDSNPNYGSWLSHDITFDRCHIAGKFGDSRFAFAISGQRVSVTNSRIDEFAGPRGTDSAGFWFSNAGDHVIENNFVSAGMWNIFMGGADSDSPNRATIVSGNSHSATLSNFEGIRPQVGDLLSILVWLRPDQDPNWHPTIPAWLPNTFLPQYSTIFAGQDFLGRTRFFYVKRAGTTGATPPNWNSTDEYQTPFLEDGTLQWAYFNGEYMVGKVTAISGDTVDYVAEGPTGIVLPPVIGSVIRWNGYNPSAIIRRNHFFRPAAWALQNAPNKGMFQLKNAANTLIEGNFFDVEPANTPNDYRPGLIALTPGNQGYSAPWSTARNITIRYNRARHAKDLFNWSLSDYVKTNLPGGNITAEHNLFEDILNGFLLLPGGFNITVRHNTVLNQAQKPLFIFGSKPTNLIYEDNIVGWHEGPFFEFGNQFNMNVIGGSEKGNVFVDVYNRTAEGYPPTNNFPNSQTAMTWAAIKIQPDGRLAPDSPFKGRASDGTDPGADISLIEAVMGGINPPPPPTPNPSPTPPPQPTSTPTPNPSPTPTATPTATPTPGPNPSPAMRSVSGYVFVNGSRFEGALVQAGSQQSTSRGDGYFAFAAEVPIGTQLVASAPRVTFQALPVSADVDAYFIGGTSANPTPSPTPIAVETVWVEDSIPAGATLYSDNDSWNWVGSSPSPYSGAMANQSAVASGMHQQFFQDATATLTCNTGDTLFAYVFIDPSNVPDAIMLQWNDGTWDHRAYWGSNSIVFGTDGTNSRRFKGALPPAGQWVRLEVPASQVGLEGKTIHGMAFTLHGGRASWDRAGRSTTASIANPIDEARNFVRQHYLDFLGREPDSGGWDYWTQQITSCPAGATACVQARRISVTAAFFVEQEFQQTGSFVYRFYRSSLGRQPSYAEFLPDRAQVVASPNLEANKQSLANAWVQRTEFLQKYPAGLTGTQFIDALLQTVQQTSGADPWSHRSALINDWNASGSRARIVRMVADIPAVVQAEYNPSFVLMQYFGYLRRDPDPGGYSFWLDVLNNRAPNNHRGMVCAFITSAEYQLRFGGVVTHTNGDCGP